MESATYTATENAGESEIMLSLSDVCAVSSDERGRSVYFKKLVWFKVKSNAESHNREWALILNKGSRIITRPPKEDGRSQTTITGRMRIDGRDMSASTLPDDNEWHLEGGSVVPEAECKAFRMKAKTLDSSVTDVLDPSFLASQYIPQTRVQSWIPR